MAAILEYTGFLRTSRGRPRSVLVLTNSRSVMTSYPLDGELLGMGWHYCFVQILAFSREGGGRNMIIGAIFHKKSAQPQWLKTENF